MIVVVLSYILGAVPGGYLITRYVWDTHAGWLQSSRMTPRVQALLAQYGPAAYSTLADVLKGALTVWLVPLLAGELLQTRWAWLVYPLVSPGLVQVAALATAVLSHVLSVYVCGWGGKGVATALGGFLVLAPYSTTYALMVCAVAAAASRRLWVSTLAAAWALPVCIWHVNSDARLLQLAALALALFTTAIHLREFRQPL
jgi:glycerol-3-phosphate acyltransferase PlsY